MLYFVDPLFSGDVLAPTSPCTCGAFSVVVIGDDGAEPLDGEGDGGHLFLPASAVDEDGDQVLLQASLLTKYARGCQFRHGR